MAILPVICSLDDHDALKADPARFAVETRYIGTSMGLRLHNCKKCESTLVDPASKETDDDEE